MMFLEFLPYWLFESYFVTNAIHTAIFLCMIIFMRYIAVKSIRDSKNFGLRSKDCVGLVPQEPPICGL